jgi:isopentenyl diphosphate isomerase/L-lactate dehydrogenase-like FMN-dependent dehydrogenase
MIMVVLGFLAIQAERSRVERVLEILDDEFTKIMRQVGALNIYQITRDTVT